MIRKPRDYTPHLRAEHGRQFPHRPPKEDFSDETLVMVAFIMRQLEHRTGVQPILEPPAYPEGYDPQPTVKASGRRRISDDG